MIVTGLNCSPEAKSRGETSFKNYFRKNTKALIDVWWVVCVKVVYKNIYFEFCYHVLEYASLLCIFCHQCALFIKQSFTTFMWDFRVPHLPLGCLHCVPKHFFKMFFEQINKWIKKHKKQKVQIFYHVMLEKGLSTTCTYFYVKIWLFKVLITCFY